MQIKLGVQNRACIWLDIKKGFKKVFVEKEEERKAEFEIGKEELGYYNRNGIFEVEKGKFDIYIGADCYADKFCIVEVI